MFQEMFWTVALSDYHIATSWTAGHYPVGYSREPRNVHGHFEFLLCLNILVRPCSAGHYPVGNSRKL
jgi:hypothetical protein